LDILQKKETHFNGNKKSIKKIDRMKMIKEEDGIMMKEKNPSQ
jgi:hypothetical protein